MDQNVFFTNALNSLLHYCSSRSYQGWDNYDGLNSKLLRNSPAFRSPFLRLAWIQFFKHCPVNLRGITLVPAGHNAKGLSLFASGLIALGRKKRAGALLDILSDISSAGYTEKCWGYNFDWQARSNLIPAGSPNIVTTVFAANAFLDYFDRVGSKKHLEIAAGSCRFILDNLTVFEDNDTLCFGYVPGGSIRVHNANMLGAALLARVYNRTGNTACLDKSKKAMAYSVRAINDDSSWNYGEMSFNRFIDNFHTGFNLVALQSWMEQTGDYEWTGILKGAYEYFLKTFWLDNGCPRYYRDSTYPVDIHCSAQGIVTCLRLSKYHPDSHSWAKRIAEWAIVNMQDETGFFYYQKTRWCTNKIPYMRWSQAWMFYALSLLVSHSLKDV
ncbi:MAG: hypothetical protein V1736_08445 [Pseudomonadota bacterium]